MQIEHLETFLDLIETRSFNRTADRLGLTQSTVSGRVAALEAAVGARLFNRSRAGTDLTTEGLKFESHARALRHAWAEARRAVLPAGNAAVALRIGIQNDLAAGLIGEWVAEFRVRLPDCAFYLEPDYSNQMCADLRLGLLDFAILFTPRTLPDLYFTTLGEVRYRLICSDGSLHTDLAPARYIRGNYSPAFAQTHDDLLPEMATAALATGQNAAVAGMLTTLGGAGFVLDHTAGQLVAGGDFHFVSDVPAITQPVYAAMHLRHRPSRLHRRLIRIVQRQLASR